MPSTMSTSVSSDLFSSTVMTPSLPTFCIACAIILPIAVSPLAEMVPTWATSEEEANRLGALLDVLDHRQDGDVDAALQIHRVHACGDRLAALAHARRRRPGPRRC